MADASSVGELLEALEVVRSRIKKYLGNKTFNEQNTKASLIAPVLQALGWDTNDSEEVHWEYKPKPKSNPVDFALLLQRTPCLFLEAKALRDDLRDDRLVGQIITYASVAGVEWVVLSNGDDYRVYNSSAPVPAEGKLFRSVRVSSEDQRPVIATLSLLSKQNLQDKKINRLWESHFVDRQVKASVEELLSHEEPAKPMVRAIRKILGGKLRGSEIRASLRRARLQLDFPEEPEVTTATAPERTRLRAGRPGARRESSGEVRVRSGISLRMLMKDGLLRAPAELRSTYRGQDLVATIQTDGSIDYGGSQYASVSTAAAMARKALYQGKLRSPQTNGWVFWHVQDPASQELVPLDELRSRYIQRRKAQADRFLSKDV